MIIILDCGTRLKLIARGATGTIFMAEDRVIKIHADYHDGDAEDEYIRHLREHQVPGHIIPTALPEAADSELGRCLASAYTVTEYAGYPLHVWHSRATVESLGYVTERVLGFMLAIHDRFGLVHGDIHEGNVLVSSDGHVTICDYSSMGPVGTVRRRYTGRPREPPELNGDSYALTLEGDLWHAGEMLEIVFSTRQIPSELALYLEALRSLTGDARVAAARAIVAGKHRLVDQATRIGPAKRVRAREDDGALGSSARPSPSPEPTRPQSANASVPMIAAAT
jgi:serine/threonine protein kinase